MSFGFSVGDFSAILQLAWQVYNALKDAPGNHRELSDDVLFLHDIIVRVDENITQQKYHLAQDDRKQLQDITAKCNHVLRDVQKMLNKYNKDGRMRAWSKIMFATIDISPFRARIAAQADRLNIFNGLLLQSSQARIENKLDKVIANLKRRGSVISITSAQSLSCDNNTWNAMGRALEEQGITPDLVRSNHDNIIKLLVNAVARQDTTHEQALYGSKKNITTISECQVEEEIWVTNNSTPSMIQSAINRTCLLLWGHSTVEPNTPNESMSEPNIIDGHSEIQDIWVRYPNYMQGELSDTLKTIELLSSESIRALSPDEEKALMKALAQITELAGVLNRTLGTKISSFLESRIINRTFSNGSTVLHIAARIDMSNFDEFLSWAIKLGARLNAQDSEGHTALVVAVKDSQSLVATSLIRNGADCMIRDKQGWLALHYAVMKDTTNVVEALYASHAKVNPQVTISKLRTEDDSSSNPIYLAATSGHVATFKALLNAEISHPREWLRANSRGATPLHALAEIDPMPMSEQDVSRLTVLCVSMVFEYLSTPPYSLVSLALLAQDHNQRNPFHCAILKGNVTMVKRLLDASHRVGLHLTAEPTGDGLSPYNLATKAGSNGARIHNLLIEYSMLK